MAGNFTIFYAWQSDLPCRENRNFIEKSLGSALKDLEKNGNVESSPRLDKDTKGITGIPDIANTILDKIRGSDAFVADVSFVATTEEGEVVPNPNVMIELGYALAEIGWERIILVLNSATGSPEKLPFDLRNRRWPFTYYLKSDGGEQIRGEEKKKLSAQLQEAIGEMIRLPPREKRGTTEQRLAALETMVSTLSGSVAQNSLVTELISRLQKAPVEEKTTSAEIECEQALDELVSRVRSGKFHNVVLQQGMFVTTILSHATVTPQVLFDNKNAERLTLGLQPLGVSGWSHRTFGDRFVATAGSATKVIEAATEMTLDGRINAASHDVISISAQFWAASGQTASTDVVHIPSVAFEKEVIEGFFKYLESFISIDVKGPWHIGIRIINIKKSILHVSQRFMFGGRVFEGEEIRPPIITVPESLEFNNYQAVARLLRPVFDFIWREHNYPRSLNYAETGDWVGQ